jgi:hypothetical protein
MKTFFFIKTILVLVVLFNIPSCKFGDQSWNELPEVKNLNSFKRTDFVPTLENPIAKNKNIIYAPAFLYAWDKISEKLNSKVIITDSNSKDFTFLNNSKSYQNALTETEYSAEAEIVDGGIIARAFFNKTLPFETKLQKLDDPINFNKTKVESFGMNYYDENAIKFSQILYYKNDNNFILKLSPTDKQHEIILVKGLSKYQTLKEAIKLTNDLIALGKKEKIKSKLAWKYEILENDIFAIPIIKFNIDTHYENLEGETFLTDDNKKHSIQEAYQRTGFILDENGAVVESEAFSLVDSVASEPVIIFPKKMIFDQSFIIIIKHTDKINPYFVMKIDNEELLMKK